MTKPKAASDKRNQRTNPQMLNPGDEAAPGTPGVGEDICPECQAKAVSTDLPVPYAAGAERSSGLLVVPKAYNSGRVESRQWLPFRRHQNRSRSPKPFATSI